MDSMKNKSCPFCGSKALYERYAVLDGFDVPIMFCDGCKCIFTVEGFEDYVTSSNDGFTELRAAWNTRQSRACYADEVTHRNCKYSVHRGWCEHTCKIKMGYCTNCGDAINDKAYFVNVKLGEGMYTFESHTANYCPSCGAKVLKE